MKETKEVTHTFFVLTRTAPGTGVDGFIDDCPSAAC